MGSASSKRVEKLTDALTQDDPGIGLRAIVELRELLEALERLHVDNARAKGWSWSRISEALGLTKQAVHFKHGQRFNSGGKH